MWVPYHVWFWGLANCQDKAHLPFDGILMACGMCYFLFGLIGCIIGTEKLKPRMSVLAFAAYILCLPIGQWIGAVATAALAVFAIYEVAKALLFDRW